MAYTKKFRPEVRSEKEFRYTASVFLYDADAPQPHATRCKLIFMA